MMNPIAARLYSAIPNITSSTAGAGATAPAASLLPEPTPNVDAAAAIAEMAVDNAFEERKEAHRERRDATKIMVAAQNDQLAKLREAADQRYAASQLDAWGKIAEGGCGVVGGLTSIEDANAGSAFSSFGKVASGLAGLQGAGKKHEADESDIAAKAAEMQANEAKRVIDDADDEAKEARDHARNALDFLREYSSTQSKSQSSALKA